MLKVMAAPAPAGKTVFEGEYESWDEAAKASTGYDSRMILEKVMNATLRVKRGEAAYERDSVNFGQVQYSWPVVCGLLSTALANHGRLAVLDFGGSLGSSFFENLAFTRPLAEVKWGIVEQQQFVACGRESLADDRLGFYDNIAECVDAISPNMILLSSVLQYIEDYHRVLAESIEVGAGIIVVDRTIVNMGPQDRTFVQNTPPQIYDASYPVYSLSESSILTTLSEGGYKLVSDFPSLPFPELSEIDSHFKGYFFAKSDVK